MSVLGRSADLFNKNANTRFISRSKININKKELLDCIDRASLLIKESDKKPIIMNITDGKMELKMNSFIGSMNEEIDIEKEGKDIVKRLKFTFSDKEYIKNLDRSDKRWLDDEIDVITEEILKFASVI